MVCAASGNQIPPTLARKWVKLTTFTSSWLADRFPVGFVTAIGLLNPAASGPGDARSFPDEDFRPLTDHISGTSVLRQLDNEQPKSPSTGWRVDTTGVEGSVNTWRPGRSFRLRQALGVRRAVVGFIGAPKICAGRS